MPYICNTCGIEHATGYVCEKPKVMLEKRIANLEQVLQNHQHVSFTNLNERIYELESKVGGMKKKQIEKCQENIVIHNSYIEGIFDSIDAIKQRLDAIEQSMNSNINPHSLISGKAPGPAVHKFTWQEIYNVRFSSDGTWEKLADYINEKASKGA